MQQGRHDAAMEVEFAIAADIVVGCVPTRWGSGFCGDTPCAPPKNHEKKLDTKKRSVIYYVPLTI